MLRPPGLALALAASLAGSAVAEGEPEWVRLYLTEPLAIEPLQAGPGDVPQLALRGATPSFEDLVMEIVNQERLANGGLVPLKRQSQLESAAETHSFNMGDRDFFSHCDLDTLTDPVDRVVAAGYTGFTSVGENIAAGYATPALVMAGWMGSAGHAANILSTGFRELGIGYALDGADAANVRMNPDPMDCTQNSTSGPFLHYWTQDFGSRMNVYPVVIDREAFSTSSLNVNLYLYGSGVATQMRIRNENGAFGAFVPFSANVAWTLSAGDGEKTVFVEIRNAAMTVFSASDIILVTGQGNAIFSDGFESGNTSAWSDVVP